MTTKPSQPADMSIGRAFVKAFILYLLFNGCYLIVQPVQNGLLPTLYNHLIPGRTRFEALYEFNLHRIVDDHIIHQATKETYNIIVLGSSEMWGNQTQSAQATPGVLDSYGFSTAEGKPVRVYNVGFPVPDVFKDLVTTQFIYEQNIPIDLVIVPFNYTSFSYFGYSFHEIVLANQSFAAHVVDLYQLDRSILLPAAPPSVSSLISDRETLGRWLTGQFLFPRWGLVGRDRETGSVAPLAEVPFDDLTTLPFDTRPGLIPAFSQFSQTTGIPVLLMEMPAPFGKNVFRDWLIEQSAQSNLPFLDCSQSFTEPSDYTDKIHIVAENQAPLARFMAHSFSDPTFSKVGPSLPLHTDAALEPDDRTCVFHPAPTS